MPDTVDNQGVLSQHPNQVEGVGFPLPRLVVLTDMSAGVLLDAAMGPCEGKDRCLVELDIRKIKSTMGLEVLR